MDKFEPCDRCRAKSYVFVLLHDERELAYCAHHGTKYFDGLFAIAFHIDDRRSQSRCGCDTCRKNDR